MIILACVLAYVWLGFATWVFYLAVMTLKSKRDSMPSSTHDLGLIVYGVGVLFDFVFNVTSSILFLEPPLEFLFSDRVRRHLHEDGWRGRLSRWFCSTLLEPFDKNHCGREDDNGTQV